MDELRLMRAHAAWRLWPATKCAAKEFINHVKFNRTINHKLGISAQDMMRGVGFKSTDLAKGAVYYRNGESGPWDPTKVDNVNARATALKFVVRLLVFPQLSSI